MKPLVRGQETGLVEIPANWYLDDLPPMLFIKDAPNSVSVTILLLRPVYILWDVPQRMTRSGTDIIVSMDS